MDDILVKHIMNKSENVILPNTWTNKDNGPKDTFLLDVLPPWFRCLHITQVQGLKSFYGNNSRKMGCRMLYDKRNR